MPAVSQTRRKLLFRLAAVAASILASALIAEAALRLAWGGPRLPAPVDSLRLDPRIGVMHVPGYVGVLNTPSHRTRVRYNSLGWRDEERQVAKPPGLFRVLALGDSFVEGHGVEYDQMFLSLAEKALCPPTGFQGIEVVKAGVGGWGPVNELRALRLDLARLGPDLVVLFFYTGNDFDEAAAPDRLSVWGGLRMERDLAESMTWARSIRVFLRKHLYLYALFVDAAKSARMSKGERMKEDLAVLRDCRQESPPPTRATAEAFAGFRQWSESAGCPVACVILPHRAQLEKARADAGARLLGGSFDLDLPSKQIAEILKSEGIPSLDLTPALRQVAESGKPIGMEADSHYNAAVHATVASALAPWLEARISERAGRSAPDASAK